MQKTVTSSVSFQEALGDEKPENERPETNFNASHAEKDDDDELTDEAKKIISVLLENES